MIQCNLEENNQQFENIINSEEFIEKFRQALKQVLIKNKNIEDKEYSNLELFKLMTHNNRQEKFEMQNQIGEIMNYSGAQIHSYFETTFQIHCYDHLELTPLMKLKARALVYDLRAAKFDVEFIKKYVYKQFIDEMKISISKICVDGYVQYIFEKDKQRKADHRGRKQK